MTVAQRQVLVNHAYYPVPILDGAKFVPESLDLNSPLKSTVCSTMPSTTDVGKVALYTVGVLGAVTAVGLAASAYKRREAARKGKSIPVLPYREHSKFIFMLF